MNELMSDKGVCTTAPATPGLLNTEVAMEIHAPLIFKYHLIHLKNNHTIYKYRGP